MHTITRVQVETEESSVISSLTKGYSDERTSKPLFYEEKIFAKGEQHEKALREHVRTFFGQDGPVMK